LVAFFILSIIGVLIAGGAYLYLAPSLPSVSVLKDVRLQIPLRIYTRQGDLISEYGEKRRKPLNIEDVPPRVQEAFLAAEDDRFFSHPGVDYQGILRAAVHLARTGEKTQGGSTITMQVARNFFLTRERTYIRKLKEVFLALKMEQELSKQEILELYLNKIYLGNRAYGIGAAAEVYYGKEVADLDLPQIAMLASLPKAPSTTNPIADPGRSLERRNYVLSRMRELGFITPQEYQTAVATPLTASYHGPGSEIVVQAPYVGEMVRAEMVSRHGDKAYSEGYQVYTTIDSALQDAANRAVNEALIGYDRRHGYRGPEARIGEAELQTPGAWRAALAQYRVVGEDLQPAVVLEVGDKEARIGLDGGQLVTLDWAAMSWARPYIDERHAGPKPKKAGKILARGDLVRVRKDDKGHWQLAQIPIVSGALVSLSPHDGAIMALSGGFDFQLSKFNRVTQAKRQPGSNFKPFIYSAALEKGFTPASIINDAPIVFRDTNLEGTWRPQNYSGKFFGPTRLRVALSKSRNLVSIRLLKAIGVDYALDYVERFGFDKRQLPRNLSLALGSGSVTPLQLARGFAIFANSGYLISPYLIDRIERANGETLFEARPPVACIPPCEHRQGPPEVSGPVAGAPAEDPGAPPQAPRTVSATNSYQIISMMKDVIRHGTGRKAKVLGRGDLAGKTGTTNDQRDAWFSGYNPDIVTTVWVGFDDQRPMGRRETGAVAALPMWIAYMKTALERFPEHDLPQPEGMVTVRIDPETGLLASAGEKDAIFETFRVEVAPKVPSYAGTGRGSGRSPATGSPDQLF